MAKYIALINWTEKGVKDIKGSPGRADKARALAKKLGGDLQQLYMTMGSYDLVAILDSTAMNGVGHGNFQRPDVLRATFVHAAAALDTLGSQPNTGLINSDDFRLELFGQGNRVVNVVEVGVRNQDGIDAVELMILRILGIAIHPGIHDNDFAGVQAKLKRRVA